MYLLPINSHSHMYLSFSLPTAHTRVEISQACDIFYNSYIMSLLYWSLIYYYYSTKRLKISLMELWLRCTTMFFNVIVL